MIDRFDAWLGLRVFQPPAILLCWLLRCTQWRLYRDMWFMFALWMVWKITYLGNGNWIDTAIWFLMAMVLWLVATFKHPDTPQPSFLLIRIIWMIRLPFDCLNFALFGGPFYCIAESVFILTAEYAATITNLPPPPSYKVRKLTKVKAHG